MNKITQEFVMEKLAADPYVYQRTMKRPAYEPELGEQQAPGWSNVAYYDNGGMFKRKISQGQQFSNGSVVNNGQVKNEPVYPWKDSHPKAPTINTEFNNSIAAAGREARNAAAPRTSANDIQSQVASRMPGWMKKPSSPAAPNIASSISSRFGGGR